METMRSTNTKKIVTYSVGKTSFESHTKPAVEAIQESTSIMRDNI